MLVSCKPFPKGKNYAPTSPHLRASASSLTFHYLHALPARRYTANPALVDIASYRPLQAVLHITQKHNNFTMPNAKPAILLVHGAWHLPSAYDYLVPHLAKAGYEVERVTLPSVSTNTPLPDKSQDVAAVRASIQSLAEADKDVVLVVHSYGGIPGSDAAEGMAKEARAATGKRGGIVHIVYLTAFVCAERECLVDAQRGEHADFIDFHDVSETIEKKGHMG